MPAPYLCAVSLDRPPDVEPVQDAENPNGLVAGDT